jgi:pSer/pThr/pTyr-binding forkhead associated (FHA) protein
MLGEAASQTTTVKPPETLDIGAIRPWRIAILIKQVQVELIVTLTTQLVIGRSDPRSDVFPNVDLRPFDAETLGISRKHLVIKLDSDGVAVEDLNTVNGSKLNGVKLEPGRAYPVRHGDELVLGAMEMQVQLLLNPLE